MASPTFSLTDILIRGRQTNSQVIVSGVLSHREKKIGTPDRRLMNSKHSDSSFAPVIPMAQEKCQRFQLVHPFTCMVVRMTGSGKTVWVQSLLPQAQTVIDQPPERITWCYSQWQPAYTQLLMMIPTIEFVKGIPESLENDSY